jgi:hypothetical protein
MKLMPEPALRGIYYPGERSGIKVSAGCRIFVITQYRNYQTVFSTTEP